jgi:transposase
LYLRSRLYYRPLFCCALLSYDDWANQFKFQIKSAINQWIEQAGGTAGNLLRSLIDKASQWWYFLDHPEVPPDNNLAERTLRLAVTKRKVSGGSRSMEGFKHTANLLFVNGSAKLSSPKTVCD